MGKSCFNDLFVDKAAQAKDYLDKPQIYLVNLKSNHTTAGQIDELKKIQVIVDLKKKGTYEGCGLQRQLLISALDAVAPGGVVAYATCSPHLAETSFVVSDVLKKRPDIEQLDARSIVEEVAPEWAGTLGQGPGVQLWPHRHDTDGMFLALLRKHPTA